VVRCCGAILGAEVQASQLVPREEYVETVFNGVIEDDTLEPAIRRSLLTLLDRAQKVEPARGQEVVWIALKEV
jgi:hypothetical protein